VESICLDEPATIQPALFKLSSSIQSERDQLLTMFSGEQFADWTLNNSCDFEMLVSRDGRPASASLPIADKHEDNRAKALEHALLMPFRDVEAMIKKTASDFGGWKDLDFLSELNDQLDHLQSEILTVNETELIFGIAKEMYLCCPIDIAPTLKKHVLICNQFLIIAREENVKAS